MSAETLQKLSNILDTLVCQESPGKQRDSNSINALLSSVLVSYENRKLDRDLTLGGDSDLNESVIVGKIFAALKSMFSRNPSLLVENNRHITVLKSAFPFFNCLNCSVELADEVLFVLIQICSECFRKNLLIYNRLISQQREYIIRYLESLLSDIIKSFTNSDSSGFSSYDSTCEQNLDLDLELKAVSIETFSKVNVSKIAKIAIAIKITQFLVHPSIYKLFFVQYQSSYILDSYLSKCWFCLENIIVNVKFTTENVETISLLDNLYSTLLLSTVNSYCNDNSFQFSKLQLAVKSCHFLLNWSLLTNFDSLQIVLAQCLLKLALNLDSLNNIDYLWRNIGLTKNSVSYFSKLIEKVSHHELKNAMRLLSNANYHNSEELNSHFPRYTVAEFRTIELQSLHKRMEQTFFYKDSKFDGFTEELTPHVIDEYDLGLSKITASISSLSTIDIIKTINRLGKYGCYITGNYDLNTQTCKLCDSNFNITSYVSKNVDINRPKTTSDPRFQKLYSSLEAITSSYFDTDNSSILISLLIALTRVFRALRPPKLEGKFWELLKRGFENKVREIRLLTVKLFPLVIYCPEDQQFEHDLDLILSHLFTFSPNSSNLHVFEGYISSLGELLVIKSVDSKYYIILNQLIKFMSDSDEFRSNLAIYELRIVAATKNVTPWQIVEPFIPLLSRDIVRARNSNPGILTNFCAAIEMNLSLFLERTLKYTVPFLINCYKEDHISFIATSIKRSKSDLIRTELDEILAYLFATYEDISHTKILNILSIYDPYYKTISFDDLLVACKGPYFLYNLLYHYNSEAGTFERIKKAIGMVSVTLGYGTSENEATQRILNRWLLIIVQMVSTTLNDQKGYNPFTVKIRAIKSVTCLSKLCTKFDACLGQIITALQLASKYDELRTEALLCIKSIINTVNPRSVEFIFDSLLSQFIQQFSLFSDRNKALTTDIILSLLKIVPNKDLSYRFALKKLPSMQMINFQHVSDRKLVADFRIRLKSDNKWIIEQVLDDLVEYLEKGQIKFHQMLKEDELLLSSFMSIIDTLVTNSFRTNISDAGSQISYKSAKAISLLGNLDLNNSSALSRHFTHNTYDNVTNFLLVTDLYPKKNSEQEVTLIEFSTHFLKNILVRSFVSSVNPEEQRLLAYTIQEYLAIFQFPTKTWESLDDLTKNILEPLKVTRYKQNFKLKLSEYPIYKSTKEYSVWLKELTANLLHTCTVLAEKVTKIPTQIESICSVIPVLDLSISKFVLPYAVLFLVIIEPENNIHKKNIHKEFMQILEQELNTISNDVVKECLKKCAIVILEILQFLKAWISKAKEEEDAIKATNRSGSKNKRMSIQRVTKFIDLFPTNVLAKRCAECDIYEGAILFLEKSLKQNTIAKEDFFSTLKDMYVELENYDELHGALKTFSTNSLNDKLLQFKYNEDIQVSNESLNAIAQYDFEGVINTNVEQLDSSKGAVTKLFEVLSKNCEYDQLLLNLKNYTMKSENETNKGPINQEWVLQGIQASIFTGDTNDLKKWTTLSQESNVIAIPGSDLSIYYEIAVGLMALKDSSVPRCLKHLEEAVKYIGLAISNSENITHRKIPDYMVLLHALYDFKLLVRMDERNDSTIQHLKRRLQSSKKDFKSIWKIHSMKSSIYRLHSDPAFQELYKDSLIEGCMILRENGKLPQATKLITKALVLNDSSTTGEMTQASTLLMNVEFSKLFWAQNDYETALKTMGLVVKDMSSKNPYFLDFSLTYLNWLDISAEGSSDLIREKYNILLNDKRFERSAEIYYQYAVYLNKLLEAQVPDEADGSLDIQVIKYYILAVSYSKTYAHEILPKAITLWLDYYNKYLMLDSSSKVTRKLIDSRSNTYQKINLTIEKCVSELGCKWYIVLSQIISRITHDDKKITDIISKVIIELTVKYPWLLLYSVFAQARSVDNNRRKIGTSILTKLQDTRIAATNGTPQLSKLIASGLILLEAIMSVCNATHNYKHPKSGNLFKDLYKDLNFDYPRDSECCALALPIKYNMDLLYNLRNDVEKRVIFYMKFHEKVKILFSLQQPKRVKVTGTNGSFYYLLFKPRDDLRKDNKVMEFSTVMNDLLAKNYETQTRNMQIKSFAATPLNETTGIIEWVQNFITLRPIIDKQLKRNGITLNMRSMKAELGEAKEDDKLNIFEAYLKKYPPVLGEWMVENSPNITEWYKFRSLFTRSLAVMSVVGYLIGVGDRHLDNIMLNKNTGMIMHIDFDCMFEKGKKLSVPEIVPFRLTPNLEEAMGVLGFEGSFRKSCELTMSLIRDNENILMNFLESFIHDPLMDWRSNNSSERGGEERNQLRIKRNQERVYKILRRKICGILTKDDDNTGYRDSGGLSVSVSFQVDLLIQTAVSHENLSKMFFGWMPFL